MFKLFLLLFAASTLVLPMAACAVINDQLDPKPKVDEPNANGTLVEGTTAPAWKVKLEERQNAAKLRREELLKEAQKRREERLERRKKFQEDYAKWLRLTPERKREELKKWLEGRKKERKQRIAERQQKIRAQIEAVKNRRNGVVVTTQAPEVEANATASPPAEMVTPDQVQSVLNGNVGNSANALGGSTVEEVGNGTQALGNETETNGGAGNAAGNVESATVGNAETSVNAVENEKTLAGNTGGCPCPTENQAVKQVDPPALADAKQSAADSQQQAQGNSENSVNSDEQKAETGTANQRQDAKGELTVDSAEPNNSESVNAEPSTENDASPVQSSQNQPSAPVEKESSSTDSNPPVNEQPKNAAKAPAVADLVKADQKNEREKAKKGVGQTANNAKTRVPAAASKKEAKLKAKQ